MVKDINNIIDYPLKKELKVAGELGKLICEECAHEVILKAGPEKAPHFAHKRGASSECAYKGSYYKETEEHREGKFILYHYFKMKYPGAYINSDHKFDSGNRSDLYVRFYNNKELVIEFQRTFTKTIDWLQRHDNYKELGITDLWFMAGNKEGLKNLTNEYKMEFFEQMILNEVNEKTAIYFNVFDKEITFIRKMTFDQNGKIVYEKLYRKTYKLDEIKITPDGKILCPFDEEFNKEKLVFNSACEEDLRSKSKAKMNLIFRNVKVNESKPPKRNTKTFQRPQQYWYRKDVIKAITGSPDSINKLIRGVNQGPDNLKLIEGLFKEYYLKGNLKAKEAFIEVLKKGGLYGLYEDREAVFNL
jgi:competence CoiA-like predicted nuclease